LTLSADLPYVGYPPTISAATTLKKPIVPATAAAMATKKAGLYLTRGDEGLRRRGVFEREGRCANVAE
jgi:hypothetical protein